MKKHLIKICALLCALSVTVPLLGGCEFLFGAKKPVEPVRPEPDPVTVLPVLRAEGDKVIDGEGNEVILRGINAGGLFVTEHWMTGFVYGSTPSNDYLSLTQTFISRFGEDKTKELWAEYRANWWSDYDFKTIADMGMNVIRLPFTYMNIDFDAISGYENAGENYDFTALDDFVNTAAEYGLYTILDLHGAYGSQNGQDHSGERKTPENVDFYSNGKMQDLTVKLWSALADHYKDNPAVAGYDILNEPAERTSGGTLTTEKRHWDVFDKIYKAIRENDDRHVVVMESCWGAENLPLTSTYGWENCMYSFHHYVGDKPTPEAHISNWRNKIVSVSSRGFGVPLQMGEFCAYGNTQKWVGTLDLLQEYGWHWTSWTYKIFGSMAWGVVNVGGEKIDPANDSYDDIIASFDRLKTENGKKYTFADSGRTLEEVIKANLTKNT